MRLFEIDNAIANCFILNEEEVLDTETGEVLDASYLENLEMQRDVKIENIAKYIRNLDSDAKQLKEQKDIFAQRQKATENKRDSLKAFLSAYLDGQKWQAADKSVQVSFRKSEQVEIINENNIPIEYLITQPAKIDKNAIKKSIKDGIMVQGAAIITNNNIQVK